MLCKPVTLDFASQLTSFFCACDPYRVHAPLHAFLEDPSMVISDVSRMQSGHHLRPGKTLIANIANIWLLPCMRSNVADQVIRSIVVAFTEPALKIASILGFGWGLGGVQLVSGRRLIEHCYPRSSVVDGGRENLQNAKAEIWGSRQFTEIMGSCHKTLLPRHS
jgi:hypothetical protein